MVRLVRSRSGKDWCKVGIHLLKPSKSEIDEALDEAKAKMFPVVYVHRLRLPEKLTCPRRG